MVKYNNRLGEIRPNKYGTLMKIIEYKDANHMKIEFQDENKVIKSTKYEHFSLGNVDNPYDKTVFDMAFTGVGNHRISENGRALKKYSHWAHMVRRCAGRLTPKNRQYYKDCTLSEDWLNYQNFCDWYDINYYEIDGAVMCLDKDIIKKGNKKYSAETCVFVPSYINVLFTKNNAGRGTLPIGVEKDRHKFRASCGKGDGVSKYLGVFDTPEEAFCIYKKEKEEYIKRVAESHKDRIPNNLYEALLRYEVEITD